MEETSRSQQTEPHSSEVQEILGKVPNNLVRWGITVIFLVIVSLLFISWFIKYPDLITAKVVITTNPPPVSLVSRASGNLHLLKKENDKVKKGEVIAYLQSNASLDAVLFTEDQLKKGTDLLTVTLPGSLGDLQLHYATLISALTSLNALNENRIYDKQIGQLQKQIITYQKLGHSLAHQQKLFAQELKLNREKFITDSVLFVQKVTSVLDFNQARANWLLQQRNARNAETFLLNNETQINQLNKQISDLEIQKIEQQQKLELAVKQAKEQLLAQITKWKESYVFIASSSGSIAYLGFLEDQQFVDVNKPLLSIIPGQGKLVARAELPIYGSGKVTTGQSVNIRLENYPFEQFGLVNGRISAISLMAGEGKYWVTIELPEQLVTNQNKILPFKQELSGSTEIITEDLRLLERFLHHFRRILARTK
jgi:multidrug efflux pump subunit AcrA (membrane-fusion protein)